MQNLSKRSSEILAELWDEMDTKPLLIPVTTTDHVNMDKFFVERGENNSLFSFLTEEDAISYKNEVAEKYNREIVFAKMPLNDILKVIQHVNSKETVITDFYLSAFDRKGEMFEIDSLWSNKKIQ